MELEKVIRKISAQCKEKYKGNFRFAFFNDANNDLQIVCIISSEDIYGIGFNKIKFLCFNDKLEKTGFINIEEERTNIYLSEVYTTTKVRGRGIAKELSHIMDYYIKSMNKEYIYGLYLPQQMGEDVKKHIDVDEDELDKRARAFYESIGFEIMDINNFEQTIGDEQIISFDDNRFNVYSTFMLGDHTVVVYKELKDVHIDCGYHLEHEFLVQDGLENDELKGLIEREKGKIDKIKSLLLSFGWSEGKVERFIELDREFGLLNGMKINDRKLPKDLVVKIKDVTSGHKMNVEDVYSTLYEVYVSLKDRGIVVKR